MEVPSPRGVNNLQTNPWVEINADSDSRLEAMLVKGSGLLVRLSSPRGEGLDFIQGVGIVVQTPYVRVDGEIVRLDRLRTTVISREGVPPGQVQHIEREVPEYEDAGREVLAAARAARAAEERATAEADPEVFTPKLEDAEAPRPVKSAAPPRSMLGTGSKKKKKTTKRK